MNLGELRHAFTQITGKTAPETDKDLLVACLLTRRKLFNALAPYIKNIKYRFDVFSLDVSKKVNKKYYKTFAYGAYERGAYVIQPPPLWKILMYYPSHHVAIEFIINNWNLFYEEIETFIMNIFDFSLTYSYNDYIYTINLPRSNESCKLLMDFLRQVDGIKYLNKYQVGYETILNYEIVKIFVMELDSNHKYEILAPNAFFKEFVKDGAIVFKQIFELYRNNIKGNPDCQRLLKHCLHKKQYDSYILLYNAGIKLSKINWYGDELINLNNEVNLLYTIRHLLPIDADPGKMQTICCEIVKIDRPLYFARKKTFKRLKVIVDILDYNLEVSNQKN